MLGRVVYPLTRDVIIINDELWIERPRLKCYLRATNTGVYEATSSSVLAYVASSIFIQNNLYAYLAAFEGSQAGSLPCFISSPMMREALECYLEASDLFKGYFDQHCFIAAADNFFLTQAAYVRGLQDAGVSQNCFLAGNEIIQFVQQCYVA